mmetsp:Transcript_813/g.1259  ORF Transcript_813/g.1259 Transcript_813/m.1259 type:complete len:107 (+) Transcript_813:1608-1928(+)
MVDTKSCLQHQIGSLVWSAAHQLVCVAAQELVTKHDPPLVFDLDNDIAEANPLTLESALAKRLNDALDRHRESFIRFPNQPNQMHLMQNPWLLPCCDPPKCACNKE